MPDQDEFAKCKRVGKAAAREIMAGLMNTSEHRFHVRSDGQIRRVGSKVAHAAKVEVGLPDVCRQLLRTLEQCESDLVRVASAVYQVDRLAPRHEKGSTGIARELEWPRVIAVSVEVAEPERWQASKGLLQVSSAQKATSWRAAFRSPSFGTRSADC